MQSEAEAQVDRLCRMVEQILLENKSLRRHLIGDDNSITESHTSIDFEISSVYDGRDPSIAAVSNASSVGREVHDSDARSGRNNKAGSGRLGIAKLSTLSNGVRYYAFEDLLASSWVYRRAASKDRDTHSIGSRTTHTASWSMLSGISVSQISNIAVLELPIYAEDVNHNQAYHFGTFESWDRNSSATLPDIDEDESDPDSDNSEGYLEVSQPFSARPSFRRRVPQIREEKRKVNSPADVSTKALAGGEIEREFGFIADTSARVASAWLREPVGDLADGLNAAEIREFMERDRRSREDLRDAEVQRRLWMVERSAQLRDLPELSGAFDQSRTHPNS
jgi:hypothetical protein